jgi:hypothetical protein
MAAAGPPHCPGTPLRLLSNKIESLETLTTKISHRAKSW